MDIEDTIELVKRRVRGVLYVDKSPIWTTIYRRSTYASKMNIKAGSLVNNDAVIKATMLYLPLALKKITLQEVMDLGYDRVTISIIDQLNLGINNTYWDSIDCLRESGNFGAMIVRIAHEYDDLNILNHDWATYSRISSAVALLMDNAAKVIGQDIALPGKVTVGAAA